MFKDHEVIREYLVRSGFMDNNFIWTKHGGTQPRIKSVVDEREEENMYIPNDVYSHHDDGCEDDAGHGDECFDVEELMRNIVPNVLLWRRNKSFDNFEMLDKALRDLYKKCKGCDKEHMVLWMTLELLKLNASNGWSNTSFLALLELLTKVLPKSNSLPSSTYQAKKIICSLTLGIEKIHVCPDHCILYRKEHEFNDRCPTSNASRYKWNNNIEEVDDDSNKKSNKRQGLKGKNATPDLDIEESK
jgi:hypothetical protein